MCFVFHNVQVDDKYQYSCENKDNKVHGFICFDPPVGFWQITPSNEFRTGGPLKQDLTSHVNPTTLAVCYHYHSMEPQVDVSNTLNCWTYFTYFMLLLNCSSNPNLVHLFVNVFSDVC